MLKKRIEKKLKMFKQKGNNPIQFSAFSSPPFICFGVENMRHFWRGTLTQPFGTKLFRNIWRKHNRFLVKTVMLKDNDVDSAFHLLNRLMEREGLLKIIRSTVRYQKPFMQRAQLSIDTSKAILEEDRDRKLKFLVRKHRADAFPGQMTI